MDDDEDFDGPDAEFKIPTDQEDNVKTMIYELAVRNFLATFSPECLSATSEEERGLIKERILDDLARNSGDFKFHADIPPEVYNYKKACVVFDEHIKRDEDNEYVGKNIDLMDVATKITIEIYENTCLRMVDRGELQLVFDPELNDFSFKPTTKTTKEPSNVINKSRKPRRKKQ